MKSFGKRNYDLEYKKNGLLWHHKEFGRKIFSRRG